MTYNTQSLVPGGDRRGAVLPLVAVSLFALVAIVAIAVDGGLLLTERRHAQAVADAAALSAASELYAKYWTFSGADGDGEAKKSALTTAADNGYTNDQVTSKVTVNIPPLSGPYVNRRGYAEVIVQYNETRGFSSIFGGGTIPVRARAVSLGAAVAADVGILVLDPAKKAAFNAQGAGLTIVNGTPVVVNSKHLEGTIAGGGGGVKAPEFFLSGGWTSQGGGLLDGDIYTNRPGLPDPLANLPPPDPSTMDVQSTKKIQYTSGSVDLQPGVFQGGISVSGTGSLNLAPGIYYMDGGGFSFTGQGSLVGNNVLIYNAPGPGNADRISVSGQGSMILSGPLDGPYQGITFWQDRTSNVTGNVQGSGADNDGDGNPDTSISGTFYFAGALLKVSGNGGVANLGSQYISRLLELSGNGGINIDWQPEYVARGRTVTLVE